ncbi:Similar to SCAMP2: Secretory carrier-associated membrane protein 2 (Homo sapiens), partial [Cotesia congregata]
VRRAANTAPASRGIEDYNPFADPVPGQNNNNQTQQVRGASNPPMYGGVGATPTPATLQPTQEIPPPNYTRRNNWPPLPEKCCFQPCFYQDIDVDIHTDFQRVVRQLYYLWISWTCIIIKCDRWFRFNAVLQRVRNIRSRYSLPHTIYTVFIRLLVQASLQSVQE